MEPSSFNKTNYHIFLSHEGVIKGNTFPDPIIVCLPEGNTDDEIDESIEDIEKCMGEDRCSCTVKIFKYKSAYQHAIDSALEISDQEMASEVLIWHVKKSDWEKMKPYKIEGHELEEIELPSYHSKQPKRKQYRLKPVSK